MSSPVSSDFKIHFLSPPPLLSLCCKSPSFLLQIIEIILQFNSLFLSQLPFSLIATMWPEFLVEIQLFSHLNPICILHLPLPPSITDMKLSHFSDQKYLRLSQISRKKYNFYILIYRIYTQSGFHGILMASLSMLHFCYLILAILAFLIFFYRTSTFLPMSVIAFHPPWGGYQISVVSITILHPRLYSKSPSQ